MEPGFCFVPQGLKPVSFARASGTTEVVAFPWPSLNSCPSLN